jgi:hypothetical protein
VSESMLLDRFLPRYDAVRIERRLLMGDPASVWDAVLDADFMRTADEMPAVRFLFGARSLAERAVAAVRGAPAPAAPEPECMRLRDLEPHGEWVRLDEEPPHEVAFGAIGRFWAGETVWEQIEGPGWRRSPAASRCVFARNAGRWSATNVARLRPIRPPGARSCATGARCPRSSGSCCERSFEQSRPPSTRAHALDDQPGSSR